MKRPLAVDGSACSDQASDAVVAQLPSGRVQVHAPHADGRPRDLSATLQLSGVGTVVGRGAMPTVAPVGRSTKPLFARALAARSAALRRAPLCLGAGVLLGLLIVGDTSPTAPGAETSASRSRAFSPAAATDAAGAVPDGLTGSEWAGIRREYERHRHQVVTDVGRPRQWHARNPRQQWQSRFDGRGFLVEPDAGGWTWGLALERYGVAGVDNDVVSVASEPKVHASGDRVTYQWNDNIEEWFVNEPRGLEHGFTVQARPAGGPGPLTLQFGVRGNLSPRVQPAARAVTFVDDRHAAVVTYAGLNVTDADGRPVASWFEAADHGLRVVADDQGARYPLTIDPVAQQAFLKAANSDAGDRFGWSVAISGDTVVVGATGESSNAIGINGDQTNNTAAASGAAYVFTRTGGMWTEQAYLKASNTDSGDGFGQSVAISGDTIVVGAQGEASGAIGVNGDETNNRASQSGAAYVFTRTGGAWTQQAYLKASNTDSGDGFGHSVAISADTVVVGALNEDSNATRINGDQTNGLAPNSGAAYVFTRANGAWTQQAYLKASNTASGDMFGDSVALSGDTVVVGALNEDSIATNSNHNQSSSVATNAGSVYVFVRASGVWTQQAYLTASATGSGAAFGHAVAVSGDTLVVGTPGVDGSSAGGNGKETINQVGALYVFSRSGVVWAQQAYLKTDNADALTSFGADVAISGDTVVVGADGQYRYTTANGAATKPTADGAGSVYVFTRTGTVWAQQASFKSPNTSNGDTFGGSVAISAATVVVGGYAQGTLATPVNGATDNSGAAYVFAVSPNSPPRIAPRVLTSQRGSPAQLMSIGTVGDNEDAVTALAVTATPSSGVGVTISNILVDVSGTVTARVIADCSATTTSFALRVTDSGGLFADATLTVAVAADAAPIEGSYPATRVVLAAGTSVTPSAPPSDNGSVNVMAATAPGFTGTLSVDLAGVLSIKNAGPVGTNTVSVWATDNCGLQSVRTTTVEVLPLTNSIKALAAVPPMGWDSWNHFGCGALNETVVRGVVDSMVTSGMAAAGYQYVILDDCWQIGRDSVGNIMADPTKFPSGIPALATYVHSRGMKLGLYTDAGPGTCSGRPGSLGHYQQDANQYVAWAIDYVKVDWCQSEGLDPQTQFSQFGQALTNAGNKIVFSICNWGIDNPWVWGPGLANLWRTAFDIADNWSTMLTNADYNSTHAAAAGPGSWNDPDSLEVGNGGMTDVEYRSHMALWAMMAAPLIAGNDVGNMSATALSTLTNSEIIAVDQDSLGVQGVKVGDDGNGLQVWSKTLLGTNTKAVMLLNRTSATASITANFSAVGLPDGVATVRDLENHVDLGTVTNSFTATVASHGVAMVKLVLAPGSPGFTVAVDPATHVVSPGGSTTYPVTVSSLAGFTGNVTLSATGLPTGSTATFDLPVVSGSHSGTLTVSTTSGIAPGTSTLTILATSGTVTHTATTTLSVASSPPGASMYLSDLNPTGAVNGWGPYERDESNGELAANDGHPITIGAVQYRKGLGVHAASDVRYAVPTGCSTFTAVVGVDDEVGSNGSVVFQVFADGTKLFDSALMIGTSPNQPVTVTMTGKAQLQLVVTDGGDGVSYDHADWADAKFTCGADTTSPTIVMRTPADGAAGVGLTTAVTATFSEAMAAASLTASTVTLTAVGGSTPVPATVSYAPGSLTVTLTPTAGLQAGTAYTARVRGTPGGATDLTGNTLATDLVWTFTTAGSNTVYLSSLTPVSAVNGWGPYERDQSNGEIAANDGLPITIAGVKYAKGLGVHAAADLRYGVPTGCSTFAAVIGVDDEVGNNGSVVFQAFADGTKLFDSGLMIGSSPNQPVTVTVAGKAQLQLVVTDGGDGNGSDHADWADAKFTCAGSGKAISVNFVGGGGAMAAAESAGVIAKSNWNNATGASSTTPLRLMDESGAATTTTVVWTADAVGTVPIADQAGNLRMMRGYLDTASQNPTTVTVANVVPGLYDLYLYGDGDNGASARTATYQLSGPGLATTSATLTDAANTNFNGTFTEGTSSASGNYAIVGVTLTGGFTITATPGASTDIYHRAPLSGFQLVAR